MIAVRPWFVGHGLRQIKSRQFGHQFFEQRNKLIKAHGIKARYAPGHVHVNHGQNRFILMPGHVFFGTPQP